MYIVQLYIPSCSMYVIYTPTVLIKFTPLYRTLCLYGYTVIELLFLVTLRSSKQFDIQYLLIEGGISFDKLSFQFN